MGDPVREPVVVPWTVDCVPVVPANLASLFITSYLVLSTPATRRLIHVCICFATGTTPIDFFDLSTNRFFGLTSLFVLLIFTCDFVISSTCRRIVLRNDISLSSVYFRLCFFDFFDLSTSRLPFLVYEKILASRLRRCDLCPCRSVLIFLFFLHSLCLSIHTFLLLILCRRCPSNICR